MADTEIFRELFDYNIGQDWNVAGKWPGGLAPSGSSAKEISSGIGRLMSAPLGNYASGAKVSRRANTPATQNSEQLLKWRFPDTRETYFRIYSRANTSVDTTSGYYVEVLRDGRMKVGKGDTTLKTFTLPSTIGAGQYWWTRFRVTGTRIQARTWYDPTSEPATWQVDFTDTTYSAAGYFGPVVYGGAAADNGIWDVGDWFIFSVAVAAPTPPTVDVGGSASSGVGVTFGRRANITGTGVSVQWTLASKPSGSTATVQNSTSQTFNITPDKAGAYVLQCRVTDSAAQTATASFTLTAVAAAVSRGGRIIMGPDRQMHVARHRVFVNGAWSA